MLSYLELQVSFFLILYNITLVFCLGHVIRRYASFCGQIAFSLKVSFSHVLFDFHITITPREWIFKSELLVIYYEYKRLKQLLLVIRSYCVKNALFSIFDLPCLKKYLT